MPRLSVSSSSLALASRVRTTSRTLSRLSRSASKDDGIAMSRAQVLQTRALGAFSPAQKGHGVDMTLGYQGNGYGDRKQAGLAHARQTHDAHPRRTELDAKPRQPTLWPRQPPCKRSTLTRRSPGSSSRGARPKTGPASGRRMHRLRRGLRATLRGASHRN